MTNPDSDPSRMPKEGKSSEFDFASKLSFLQLELSKKYSELKISLDLERMASGGVLSEERFNQIVNDNLKNLQNLQNLITEFPDLKPHVVPETEKIINQLKTEFFPASSTSFSSPEMVDSSPDLDKEPGIEIPLFVREFFQLNVIRGDLWEKEEVENWKESDYLRAIMSYISRDAMKEGVAKVPMLSIWDKLFKTEYNVASRQGKISLINDIIPTFPSAEMRENLRYFFNSLKSVEDSAALINATRTNGDSEAFFNFLRNSTPLPISLKNFFSSNLLLADGKEEKLATFGCNFGFGELAQAVTRCLVKRAASQQPDKNNAERNIFHPDANADSITKSIVKDIAILIRNNSPDLAKNDNDSKEEEAKKQSQAEASANLVVNYTIKFVATFVPWSLSDIDIKRYASLIPTKLFRFGASELKYLNDEGLQSGSISVYDKLLIAHFNRLIDSGLTNFIIHVESVSKNAKTGEITKRKESMTLLELLQQNNVVVTKNLNEAAQNAYNLDANQQKLLEGYSKVYVETLPDLINENLPPEPGRYWDGVIDHTKRIWNALKEDPLPMDHLVREVSSPGLVEDFKTKVPSETLRNSLSALYNDINYWMGDYVVKKNNKDTSNIQDVLENAMTFNTRKEAEMYDKEDRFLKLRVYRKNAEGKSVEKYILMNFKESFLLNPYEEVSNQKTPNLLSKELEVTGKQLNFVKQDFERLEGCSGDQYKMLQKLITEKFLLASVRHYLRKSTNKTYYTDDEKKCLGELMSSEYAAALTAGGTGNSLRAILAGRVPPLAREIYPIVTTGIWSKDEATGFIDMLPDQPWTYKVFDAGKKAQKK